MQSRMSSCRSSANDFDATEHETPAESSSAFRYFFTTTISGLSFENNIPRIVPFGDNANELVAFHHYQRSNVFFSHFRDGIEDRSIRVNRPSVPALLIKQLSHRSHLDPPSDTSPGKLFLITIYQISIAATS
jgi:hypothetical protein